MKTSLAERAAARRGEEDRRKRDAWELQRLRARVRELEEENAKLKKQIDFLDKTDWGEEIREPHSGKTPDNGCGCFLKTCPRCWPRRGEAGEGGK